MTVLAGFYISAVFPASPSFVLDTNLRHFHKKESFWKSTIHSTRFILSGEDSLLPHYIHTVLRYVQFPFCRNLNYSLYPYKQTYMYKIEFVRANGVMCKARSALAVLCWTKRNCWLRQRPIILYLFIIIIIIFWLVEHKEVGINDEFGLRELGEKGLDGLE